MVRGEIPRQGKDIDMIASRRRWVHSFALGIVLCLVFASAATAGTTTVPVKMTFTENFVTNAVQGCSVGPEGLCGSGQVVPFGQATETIEFGACGEGCDLRTIYLESGTIFIEETFSDPVCPGSCQPNPAQPNSGTLTDVIVGGTGAFEGATGTLTGTVRAAAPQSQVKLAGTIVLDP
jgi:hypothetical protein